VSTLENSVAVDEMAAHMDDDFDGDEWLVSRMISPEEQERRMDQQIEEEFDILDEEGETLAKNDNIDSEMADLSIGDNVVDQAQMNAGESANQGDDDDDEYADMEEFEEDNVIADDAAVAIPNIADNHNSKSSNNSNENLLKVRTYDLSITYDKYYQTPRVWMMGYTSADSSQPLTGDEMMQDVMSDYANRTVTIDPHPHVAGPHASIHPCQHGAVMKTIVRNLTKAASTGSEGEDDAKAPSVEMYLFIFLKFVSSIIPTINYDFTMDVTASTEK
jgi:ubiquitin-like-conjugating enzyme ATG3